MERGSLGQTRASMDQLVEPWDPNAGDFTVHLSEERLLSIQLDKLERRRATQMFAAMRQLCKSGSAPAALERKMWQEAKGRSGRDQPNLPSSTRCEKCFSTDHLHASECGCSSFASPSIQPHVAGDLSRRATDGGLFDGRVDPLCGMCHMRGHVSTACIVCSRCARWGHGTDLCGSRFSRR